MQIQQERAAASARRNSDRCSRLPSRHMVFLGPPGSGKGTQAPVIADELCLCHVSTGDLLRDEVTKGTPLGVQAKDIMDKGDLVPDEVMIGMIRGQMNRPDCTKGLILDGFPRTIPQVEKLETELNKSGHKIDDVILFDVEDQLLFERIEGRRVHLPSGRTYHVKFNPPKEDGKDDVTGEPLIQRKDDTHATLEKRLKNYHGYTTPLIDYFNKRGNLRRIDARQSADKVLGQIISYLGSPRNNQSS
eukprot:TRINITY_DN1708_c0_g1_i1.p1 TRINITY_DN1708_c0_g1~~TRINITY_DN1708_c0_g1_i1.p1  ORF type:complete len:246 (+),score=54.88 TRINITY_DN1708_c0_g1_i1:141-878(+)